MLLRLIERPLEHRRRGRRSVIRQLWVRPGRVKTWWENFMDDTVVASEWRENFRMKKDSFLNLCNELRPFLEKKSTTMREPLSVETQVAIALYYLSEEGRYRKIANAFGVGKSTVSETVRNVCNVISKECGPKYIKLPSTIEEVESLSDGFYKTHNFPQCIGAIDGTHIPIKQPKENPTDFMNRKDFYSFNVQAACDYSYKFFDVVVRWPGSVHDSRMFTNSELYKKLNEGKIPKNPKVIVKGVDPVPICLLGDPAYPLMPFLMKEYAGGGRTKEEQFFGFKLSSARMAIECAFGRLKARWSCLRRPMDINTKDLPAVIMACFILHNFCEINCEQIQNATLDAAKAYDAQFQPPTEVNNYRAVSSEAGGKQIRQTFKKFFE